MRCALWPDVGDLSACCLRRRPSRFLAVSVCSDWLDTLFLLLAAVSSTLHVAADEARSRRRESLVGGRCEGTVLGFG